MACFFFRLRQAISSFKMKGPSKICRLETNADYVSDTRQLLSYLRPPLPTSRPSPSDNLRSVPPPLSSDQHTRFDLFKRPLKSSPRHHHHLTAILILSPPLPSCLWHHHRVWDVYDRVWAEYDWVWSGISYVISVLSGHRTVLALTRPMVFAEGDTQMYVRTVSTSTTGTSHSDTPIVRDATETDLPTDASDLSTPD
nr:hypothetical protein [Tanacetum cinerariifolium]